MARRNNELFIGPESLTIDGRSIKHPALIKTYATVNVHKIFDRPNSLIGLDLETNYKTGELKLFGIWKENQYFYYTSDFLVQLFSIVKWSLYHGHALAYWNRLDPFVLFKQFLYYMPPAEQNRAMSHFSKISGEWDKEKRTWTVRPVCEVMVGDRHFGILNAIRSSVQFFIMRDGDREPKTIWAYDIAQLYEYGLEREALGEYDKKTDTYTGTRLPYYSKMGEEFHKIDWDRFNKDPVFQRDVLKSNELDCHACYDLGMMVQEEFKTAFGYYPASLVSQGSLARAAIVSTLQNHHLSLGLPKEEAWKMTGEEVSSIGLIGYKDQWVSDYGEDFFKDFYCLLCEAYSGGYIEAFRFGYAPTAYYSDLASAYPSVIRTLYDWRNAKITTGRGEPPHIPNSYCFIRGWVNIPPECNYHPITIKAPKVATRDDMRSTSDTNIRPNGIYRAAYILEERDFCLESGATFTDEIWYNVETEGKLSPLAICVQSFLDLRAALKAKGDTAQYRAKIASNSMYGILFEATDTYDERIVETEEEIEVANDINPYADFLKPYLHNINVESIVDELKIVYDSDYDKIRSMWFSKTPNASTPDQIAIALQGDGIFIEAQNPVAIFQEIDRMYRLPKKATRAIPVRKEVVFRAGYRAGEFWQPGYATIITGRVRVMIATAFRAIESRGGKGILAMTDSAIFTGDKNMIPAELVREKKTVGFFEGVNEIRDLVCLGSGRYSFTDDEGIMTAKRRGLNPIDLHDEGGILLTDLDWRKVLAEAIDRKNHPEKYPPREKKDKKHPKRKTDDPTITIKVRTLLSVGKILNDHSYTFEDLGRIVDEERDVDLVVGRTKRFFHDGIKDPETLYSQLVDTSPIYLMPGMFGNNKELDQTLPDLREAMMKKTAESKKEKLQKSHQKSSKKYRDKNSLVINEKTKTLYGQLRDYGYSREDAKNMSKWSAENITAKLIKDGKI